MADTSSSPNGDDENDEGLAHEFDTMSFLDCSNTEQYHNFILGESYRFHTDLRETALRTLQTHEDKREAKRLKEKADALERSVAAAEQKAQEDIRIREAENRAKQIPQLPPKAPTPPPQPTPPVQHQQAVKPTAQVNQPSPAPQPASTLAPTPPQPAAVPQLAAVKPFSPQPALPAPQPAARPQATPQPTPSAPIPAAPVVQPQPAAPHPQLNSSHILPDGPRYAQIHRDCKELRKYINSQTQNTIQIQISAGYKQHSVKSYAGDLRRSLTRTMGQLTDGAGTNMEQLKSIRAIFSQSLAVSSPGIDPRRFLVSFPASPVEGAKHNDEEMPCLFLYIVNIFAKAVVRQLCNEASVNAKIAEPIGVLVHNIITNPEYLWRGKSFIDIVMAKFRFCLPVVFGERGNEKTEAGRARLGWRKENDVWISEQEHYDRMRGLGAGYAALCLRNYSKSARVNPWPPSHYWNAMGLIVCTPPAERSATQTLVLTALIDGFEKKFLEFYGDMALCALGAALVEFPAKSPDQTPAVKMLKVLGDRLKKDMGLALKA